MKYILFLLLIALLSGCGYTADHAAKNISNKVKKCCGSFCLSNNKITPGTPSREETGSAEVPSTFVLERTGQILTW